MGPNEFHFGNLPYSIQTLIYSALVACLAFAFYTFHLKNLLKEYGNIQAEIKKLELSVAEETAIETRLMRLKQELARTEKRFELLKSILPAQKEIPAVLRSVQQMAASSNLKINKLKPKQAIPRSFYSDWPIQIELEGNYHGLGLFFEKTSRADRIINVGTISIKSSEAHDNPDRTLTASCTATTFVLKESPLETFDEHQEQKNSLAGNRGESRQ